ncbi:MAG: protein-disulfide reductase DsbD [Gammaproteobacteria bacterium]|nr:protein-disulfide reductase DsbD [Gammaproteobacteria bacterium]
MISCLRRLLPICCLILSQFVVSLAVADGLFTKTDNQHPLPAEQAFVFSQQQIGSQLALVWTIADDYYLYQDKLRLQLNGEDITSVASLPQAMAKNDPNFGATRVYYNQLSVMMDLPQVPAGGTLMVAYQGCWEGGVCYPPQQAEVILPAVTTSAAGQDSANKASLSSLIASDTGFNGTDANWFTQQLRKASLTTLIVTFFLAGVGLALTPCVLPMVPILSNLIIGINPKPGSGKSFLLSFTYVLAMAITYSLAGVIAGLSGANLQIALQHPAIILLMVILFVVFAAAMFDWITIQMPTGIQNRLHSLSQQQATGHFMGVAAMGVISALVVGPCVAAPLAGALLYISHTGDPYSGGLALFALGMGMGLPLLVIGTSAAHLVPRAGAWMNRIKYAFGFVMLYLAIWMLDRILPSATVLLVVLLTLTGGLLLWQVHRWQPPVEHMLGRTLVYLLAILMTIYSLALLASLWLGQASLLNPLKASFDMATDQALAPTAFAKVQAEQVPDLLTGAKTINKPVLMDFYADWCIACKELDTFVFADAKVQQALQQYIVIKVDVTDNTSIDQALLSQYNLVGPPGLLFFDRHGDWLSTNTIVGVPATEYFTKVLQRVSGR